MDEAKLKHRNTHAGILLACASMLKGPDVYSKKALYDKFKSTNGTTLDSMLADYNATLADFAQWYPDKYKYENGTLIAFVGEETAHIREQIGASKGRGGGSSRGSARGGRGGGGRGGYANAGGSFRGGRGGGMTGFNRGASNASFGELRGASSGFGSNSGSNSGFGSNSGSNSGFGSNSFGARDGGGYANGGGSNTDRYNRDNDRYSTSSRQKSDNRGFASNYDNFEETSTRDDRFSRSSTVNYDDRSDRFSSRDDYNRTRDTGYGSTRDSEYGSTRDSRDYGSRRDEGYRANDSEYDRGSSRNYRDDDDNYNSGSRYGRGSDVGSDRRSESRHRDNYDRGYDRRGSNDDWDYQQRNERRRTHSDEQDDYDRGSRRGRQSNYDGDDRRDTNNDYRSSQRDSRDRQEYGSNSGGGGGRRTYDYDYDDDDEDEYYKDTNSRRDRCPDRRREHSYDQHDRHREDERRREDEQPRSSFPSAMGEGERGTSEASYPRSVFAPTEYRETSEERRERQQQQQESRRSEKSTPEDPYNAKQPSLPRSMDPPPGFDPVDMSKPPGLEYTVQPPPGLRRLTPTATASQQDPNEVQFEEVAKMVRDALMANGGEPLAAGQVIGQVLNVCHKDIGMIVKRRGGISRVLDLIAKRSDCMECYTNDKNEDEIALTGEVRNEAIRRANPRKLRMDDDLGIPNVEFEPEDSASQVSYQSANTSFRPSQQSNPPPVESEIRIANEMWNYARIHGTYSSKFGGFGVPMGELERLKNMSKTQMMKFLNSLFPDYFAMDFAVDGRATIYTKGMISPDGTRAEGAAGRGRGGEAARGHGGSTVSSRSGTGREEDKRQTKASQLFPRSHKFVHQRNDFEDGYPKVSNYKSRETVTLSAFIDWYEFYVQTQSDTKRVNDMQAMLVKDHVHLLDDPLDISVWRRDDVGCFFDPEMAATAYRVTVLDVNEDRKQLTVQSADFGWKRTIESKDITALREKHETRANCFPCATEEFEPEDEEEVMNIRRSLRRLPENQQVIIAPIEKKPDSTLVVSFSFEKYDRDYRYPEDLYTKKYASPRPHE